MDLQHTEFSRMIEININIIDYSMEQQCEVP